MAEQQQKNSNALPLILGTTTIIATTVATMLAVWSGPRQSDRLTEVEAALRYKLPEMQASISELKGNVTELNKSVTEAVNIILRHSADPTTPISMGAPQ